jgi:dATP/dGTP diphosphohydrolase
MTDARVVRPLRDDPTETNAEGGSQSVIAETFTTMPLHALRALSQLSRLGDQKYGEHNWRQIPEPDHINHAFAHMIGHCTGDRTEDHLLHAAWRLVAALEVRLTESKEDE